MAKLRFSRNVRIKTKAAFGAVFERKCFAKNTLMAVYIAPNNTENRRFAVSVSGRIRPAVSRNRLKRLAREAFRLNQNELPGGFDYILIYSPWLSKREKSDIKKITLDQVRQGFMELVRLAHKRYDKQSD